MSDETTRYGPGAVIQREADGQYYHIMDRYQNLDSGRIRYRYLDWTHAHEFYADEEDLIAKFRPAGITTDVQPARLFGGRVGRILADINSDRARRLESRPAGTTSRHEGHR